MNGGYILQIGLILGLISFFLMYFRQQLYAALYQALQQVVYRQAVLAEYFPALGKTTIGANPLTDFEAVFESAPACFKLHDRDGTLVKINRSGLTLLEAERAESILGTSIYDYIAPEYHTAYEVMSRQVFAGKSGYLEFELITLKGSRRWMRTNAEPLHNAQQRITHLVGITHDITENRLISKQLEVHRNKLQTIIESEPECVKLQDASGQILEMNPAGLALLEANQADAVIGRSMYEFIIPEYAKEYRQLTQRVFAGGRASMEFEVYSFSGKRRWMKTHAAPLLDNDGNVLSLLAITRNIDQRKQSEMRLYQQQIELARVCRLSTMGEMATSLAHELNQPLCAVSSYAESARQLNQAQAAELDSLLKKIVQQSWRATKIVQNMRAFVKKQSPIPELVAINPLIVAVMEFLQASKRREKVEIIIRIDENGAAVNADRVQIEQVLINLVTNAIQSVKHLAQSQREIKIQVFAASHEELMFKICNRGNRLSEVIVKDLFTPFFTTKETGLGMGLAISRSIVESHGGRIWYQYQADYGPCFCFTLPASKDERL